MAISSFKHEHPLGKRQAEVARIKDKYPDRIPEEAERLKAKQAVGDDSSEDHSIRTAARYPVKDMSGRRKNEDDNTDMHLAKSIMQNKQYKTSNQAASMTMETLQAKSPGSGNRPVTFLKRIIV